MIFIAFPLSRLIRNRPEEYGLLPDGDIPTKVNISPENPFDLPDTSEMGFTVKQALKTKAFWLISIGHGFTSMVLIAMMAHLAPLLTDRGHSIQTAAYVVTM